jgi:hypothetical protein
MKVCREESFVLNASDFSTLDSHNFMNSGMTRLWLFHCEIVALGFNRETPNSGQIRNLQMNFKTACIGRKSAAAWLKTTPARLK